ncbi:hypothetical protein KCU73_g124, partial [Aureobasidium melanogenum]
LSQVCNCLFEPAALDLWILLGGVLLSWLCNPAAHHINDQPSSQTRDLTSLASSKKTYPHAMYNTNSCIAVRIMARSEEVPLSFSGASLSCMHHDPS